jgi:hypothetical protein
MEKKLVRTTALQISEWVKINGQWVIRHFTVLRTDLPYGSFCLNLN